VDPLDKVWVTVPVGEREEYLPGLLHGLAGFRNRVVFVNNKENYNRVPGVQHVEDFSEVNIYRWWNRGINYAEQHGATHVAVLNDDLGFDEGFIPAMHEYLVSNQLAVVDTANSGNGGGAAWMMDLSYGLRLDERFQWWYGDTELFDRAKALGKFGMFTYPGFTHHNPNGNLLWHPQLQGLVEQDADLYRSIHAG
jgi:hypothetical protein